MPYYDKTINSEIGKIFYYGKDEYGNRVYIQGLGNADVFLLDLFNSILDVMETNQKKVLFINTLKNVNPMVRLGGFLSRRLGLIFPGRLLTVLGLRLSYSKFIKTVKSVKTEIAKKYIA